MLLFNIMHIIQQEILSLSTKQDLSKLTLKEVAIAIDRPGLSLSLLQYHFDKLELQGLLYIDKKKQSQKRATDYLDGFQAVSIPIVGSANCGPASILAVESPEGYLKISRKIIKKSDGLIAVRASGNSMNNARINTPLNSVKAPINDGDLVIVDTNIKPTSNDYVLSIIDDMANIKKIMKRDYDIALISESKEKDIYPPIIITPEDSYMVNGRVIMVCQS